MAFKLTEINGKVILKTLAGYVLNITGIKDLNTATSNVSNTKIDWTLQEFTDTVSNFTSINPVLLVGQIGIETDDLLTAPKFKIGNGVTAWNALPYGATTTVTNAMIGALINVATAATPNDTDLVATADSSVLKKITWTNVKSFLKTYFDTIYASIASPIFTSTLYGSDYGIIADGVTDNTAAFNTFMAACKAGQYKGELPLGNIVFLSKPNDIDFAWDLGGKGLNGTVLIRKYNEATPTFGLINIVAASGTKIHDMAIESAASQTGGAMVSVTSTSIFANSGIVLENLWLSTFGSDTQTYSLYIDGSLKTTAPAGVRDVSLKNVHVFGSTNYSVFLKSIIGFSWVGGGVYPAGGTGILSGGIQISGVASVKSQYVSISIVTCNGLNLTNCTNLNLEIPVIGAISGISVNNDATCSLTSVTGSLSGTVVASWITSFCNDIGNKMSFDGGKIRVTNASGGTNPTNYLEIAGATANNSNFPGIQFTGGTSPTTYASIVTNNSGQGFTIRNGSSAGVPNYQQVFMFTNSTTNSSYTDFANAGTSTMRLLGDGKLGIGTTAPTAILHLKAGTATANTAPLKLTSGTNMTTAEVGSFEYNGTNLFFTRSGTNRENVLVGNDAASAPSTSVGVAIVNFYGTSATNFLGTPNSWVSVVISGTTYKIPLYT